MDRRWRLGWDFFYKNAFIIYIVNYIIRDIANYHITEQIVAVVRGQPHAVVVIYISNLYQIFLRRYNETII